MITTVWAECVRRARVGGHGRAMHADAVSQLMREEHRARYGGKRAYGGAQQHRRGQEDLDFDFVTIEMSSIGVVNSWSLNEAWALSGEPKRTFVDNDFGRCTRCHDHSPFSPGANGDVDVFRPTYVFSVWRIWAAHERIQKVGIVVLPPKAGGAKNETIFPALRTCAP